MGDGGRCGLDHSPNAAALIIPRMRLGPHPYGDIVIDSVAAIDVKGIGRIWEISHAHFGVFAPHSGEG